MAGLSAHLGRKIMEAVDYHRGESLDHAQKAEDIDDAWQQHDYEWLHHAGVLSKRDMEEIAHAMVANKRGRRKRKRTSRRRR